MRRLARVVGLLLVAATVLAVPRPGVAQEELGTPEIEERLKLAGVDPVTRRKIHEAIEAGVGWLLAKQRESGAVPGPHPLYGNHPTGYTALAGLALAHAGGTSARQGAERAVDWLCPEGRSARGPLVTKTYEAGIGAMLLAALETRPRTSLHILQQLVRGHHANSKWWGYKLTQNDGGRGLGGDLANLSTTQFAGLGLWATARATRRTSLSVWRSHVLSLAANQGTEGSWNYLPNRGRGYPNGTFMGLANLLLGRAALADELAEDPELAARVERARARALDALDSDVATVLDALNETGRIDYYQLYALEKACVFAELEEVGGYRWYIAGAGQLLRAQNADGSWGGGATYVPGARSVDAGDSDVAATSLALLFLLRGSEVYRPTTPREIPRQVAITGGSERDAEEPIGIERPAELRLEDAQSLADELELLLEDDARDRGRMVEVLRALAHAQRVVVGREQPVADWRTALERLLLRVVKDFDGVHPGLNETVFVEATNAIAVARRPALEQLETFVKNRLRSPAARAMSRARVGAALRALARGGDPNDTVPWLVRHVDMSRDPKRVRISRAALGALATVPDAPGRERRRAVRSLVLQLEPFETAARSARDDLETWARRLHWEMLGASALIAVSHLARDGRTGEEATMANGLPPTTMTEFRVWIDRHKDAREAPWVDPADPADPADPE